MENIYGIDIFIGVVLVVSALLSFSRGFISEMLGIGSWFVALIVAFYAMPYLEPFVLNYVPKPLFANVLSLVVVSIVTLIVLTLICSKIETKVRKSVLNRLDHFLGFIFGIVRGIVILVLLYFLMMTLAPKYLDQLEKQSRAFPYLERVTQSVEQHLPQSLFDNPQESETSEDGKDSDEIEDLIKKLNTEFPEISFDEKMCMAGLKDLYVDLVEQRKNNELNRQIAEIKDYKLYNDIQDLFEQIEGNELYDAPLMLEWNVWRAMTMLDGGNIKANLNFDDFGQPLSAAQGNMADIVCDYGDFVLTVEVTLARGQKQYEMESEPVSRHLGKIKKSSNRPCYCLFIAPVINEACIAHFYALHNMNIAYYGGKSVIIPLPLSVFRKMVEDSYKASYIPNHEQVCRLFEYSEKLVQTCENELQWFNEIKRFAMNWLR